MACSHISDCALYPKISLSSALKVWQVFYCEGDFSKCVRYQTSTAGKPVPDALLPNGKLLELASVASGSKPDTDTMVKAMKEEVARDDHGSALDDLQGAMDKVVNAPEIDRNPTGLPEEFLEGAGVADESISPSNPEIVSGPTSSYYLRMRAQDKTGVMSSVISALGRHRISVDAMAQKKFSSGQSDTVMMLVTGQVAADIIRNAIEDLEKLDDINGKVISIALEYLDEAMFS